MFLVNSNGLYKWQVDGVDIIDPTSSSFSWTVNYGPFLHRMFVPSDLQVKAFTYDSDYAIINYEAFRVSQKWKEINRDTICGDIEIWPAIFNRNAFVIGLGRLHFIGHGKNVAEIYPRLKMNDVHDKGIQFAYPSDYDRLGDTIYIRFEDNSGVKINVNFPEILRHLAMWVWEPYPQEPDRCTLHMVFANVDTEIRLRVKMTYYPPGSHWGVSGTGQRLRGRHTPVIKSMRAMAEYVSSTNPYGYVNVRLDNPTEATLYAERLVKAAQRTKADLVIGWPWAFTQGGGLQQGRHQYPYHGGIFPPTLAESMQLISNVLTANNVKFGAIYRPMYHTVNGMVDMWQDGALRYYDSTGKRSISCDLRRAAKYAVEAYYLDDCGMNTHGIDGPKALDCIRLIQFMRSYDPSLEMFIEHPSVASLEASCGGYVRVEWTGDGLRPTFGDWVWNELVSRYPTARWIVDWNPWSGNPAEDMSKVITWCRTQPGYVCPILPDWLV